MTIWDWCDEYERQARERGDEDGVRLSRLHYDAYNFRETNPARTVLLLEEGRRLAQVRREPWWVLFYDHFRVEALMCFLRDYRDVVEQAVKNTLEVRKPQYDAFPLRFAIQRHLISAYIGVDSPGYAAEIQEALDCMESQIPDDGQDRYLFLGSRREFSLDMGWLDRAEDAAQQALALAANDPQQPAAEHHAVFNYRALCRIAWARHDREALQAWATQGERLARRRELQMELSVFVLWQGALCRHAGDEERARYLHRRAVARAGRLGRPPIGAYFGALCAYHDLGGELDLALQVRRRELELILGKGMFFYEAEARLYILELLVRQGLPLDDDLAAAHASARHLRAPAAYLAEIERLTGAAGVG
jgi:hypothetical protein